jgi:hypothetical protein
VTLVVTVKAAAGSAQPAHTAGAAFEDESLTSACSLCASRLSTLRAAEAAIVPATDRGELDSRPPDSVVRAREPDLLPPSGERQSRKRHPAAAPVLLHGTLTGNSRQYSGISGVCVERGLWPGLSGGGPSPLRTVIPANREFNREFCRFQCCRRMAGPWQLPIGSADWPCFDGLPSCELTGNSFP